MAKLIGQNSKYLEEQHAFHDNSMWGYSKWILAFCGLGLVIIMFGLYELFIGGKFANYLIGLGVMTAVVPMFVDKIALKHEHKSKMYRQGQKGEWEVKVELSKLPDNYAVFCDAKLLGKNYNIDFLVSGPTGLFAIEVKSFSGKVSLNNSYTLQAMDQAIKGALKVHNHLLNQTGKDVYVKALLVYSSDDAVVSTSRSNHNVTVIHKSELNRFIQSQRDISKQYNVFELENHLVTLTGHNSF
ncbi:MAG TPA: nuclease-related domain-containing protein [Candidatus Doudnabacteria bacterium]|nr:nuclease-related domain-containing protein [Candidatus Doudnabacteria bacterium]